MDKIKVIIVDDQTLMRDGLKTLLELEDRIEIVGMAKNGIEVLEIIEISRPDLILLDIRMPLMDGVETVKEVKDKYPEIKVIMLTTFNDDAYIMNALANGANGYLLKDIEVDKLVEAINDAYQGKMIMPPEVHAKLSEGLGKITKHSVDETKEIAFDFSERELEVCKMMVQGFNNKQIALALFITEGTVRNYISTIYSKVGIADRTRAVLFLKELGIK